MTIEEAKSCICTIKMLQRLAYNIHGVMDVIDADNCKKIIKALEQEPCGDLISRQKLLEDLYKRDYTKFTHRDFVALVQYQDTVQQEPCDAISRQAAIDALENTKEVAR